MTSIPTGILMTDLQALIRLQAWLSPAFPVGAFSYSHGLEAAIARGLLSDADDLGEWLRAMVETGPGWNDAVLLSESWRRTRRGGALVEISEFAEATAFSGPRHLEMMAMGIAFLKAASAWGRPQDLPDQAPLPVAVGSISAHHSIALDQTLAAYLHGYISNQIQAALRLMKLGQQGGVALLASLEDTILQTAVRAEASSLDDLGSSTVIADMAAMQHETLQSRIFRT